MLRAAQPCTTTELDYRHGSNHHRQPKTHARHSERKEIQWQTVAIAILIWRWLQLRAFAQQHSTRFQQQQQQWGRQWQWQWLAQSLTHWPPSIPVTIDLRSRAHTETHTHAHTHTNTNTNTHCAHSTLVQCVVACSHTTFLMEPVSSALHSTGMLFSLGRISMCVIATFNITVPGTLRRLGTSIRTSEVPCVLSEGAFIFLAV